MHCHVRRMTHEVVMGKLKAQTCQSAEDNTSETSVDELLERGELLEKSERAKSGPTTTVSA